MKHIALLSIFIASTVCGCQDQSAPSIFSSYEEGKRYAVEKNQNILLIFDSWGNPTLSSEQLLHDYEVIPFLKQYTVILLYVDAEGELGKKNKNFQIERFSTSVQPMYYILDNNGSLLKEPLTYCKKATFLKFIDIE